MGRSYYVLDEAMTPEEIAQARVGKLTASRMSHATKRTKTGWSEYRRKYMIELLGERLTGMASDGYLSASMLWGVETEPKAIAAYSRKTGNIVGPSKFVDHPQIPMSGATPDGFVFEDGLVEVKCPETRTHLGYMLDPHIPDEYVIQMNWQMAVTGRAWCDFCSFDPRLPSKHALLVRRVNRDQQLVKGLEKLAVQFLSELDTLQRVLEHGHVDSADIAAGL